MSLQVAIERYRCRGRLQICSGPSNGNSRLRSRTVRVCLSVSLDYSLNCLHDPSVRSQGLDGFGSRLSHRIDWSISLR